MMSFGGRKSRDIHQNFMLRYEQSRSVQMMHEYKELSSVVRVRNARMVNT